MLSMPELEPIDYSYLSREPITSYSMLSLYSNWWLKPGKEPVAVPILQELAARVLAEEPGTLMYTVHFPRFDFPLGDQGKPIIQSEPKTRPGAITFIEVYQDWDAFMAHFKGAVFKDFVTKHGQELFVQGPPNKKGITGPFTQVVFMEPQAGFIREDLGCQYPFST